MPASLLPPTTTSINEPKSSSKFRLFMDELQGQADDQELSGGTQAIRPAYEYGDQ